MASTKRSVSIPLAILAVLLGFMLMSASLLVSGSLGLRLTLVLAEALFALPAVLIVWARGVAPGEGLGLRPLSAFGALIAAALGATLWALSVGLIELQNVVWAPPPGYLEKFQQLHRMLRPDGALDAVLSLLAIAVVPALCEELVFRGVALPSLLRLGSVGAAVSSALLFGMIHLDTAGGQLSLYRVPFAFVVGLAFAAIRMRTGALGPSIVAHAILNAITFVATLYVKALAVETPEPRPALGFTLLIAGLVGSALLFPRLRGSFDAPAGRPLDFRP